MFPELDLNEPMSDHALLPKNVATRDQMTIFTVEMCLLLIKYPRKMLHLINFSKKCTSSTVLSEVALIKDSAMNILNAANGQKKFVSEIS